jgi:hypothetical protein
MAGCAKVCDFRGRKFVQDEEKDWKSYHRHPYPILCEDTVSQCFPKSQP